MSGRREWLNRDPLGEIGFETLRFATKPFLKRKLWLTGDLVPEILVAEAIRTGRVDLNSLFQNSQAGYAKQMTALELFDQLRNKSGTYALNWPGELLESPNNFDFVGNDPLNAFDDWGNTWWKPWTWEWPKNLLEGIKEGAKTAYGEIGAFLDGPKCLQNMAPLVPNMVNRNNGVMTNSPSGSDGDYDPPAQNGGGNGTFSP